VTRRAPATLSDDLRYGAVAVANTTTLCILLDGGGEIVYANAAAQSALAAGCDSLGGLLSRCEDLQRVMACVRQGDRCDLEIPLQTSGGISWHAVSVRPVREAGDEVVTLFSAVDVDARRSTEQEAWRLAYHDRLTGLPNRILFMRKLEARLLARDDGDDAFGVLVINLDRFKPVNDSLGYEAGDALLKAFARRLTDLAGAHSLVSRLAGDEFAVVTASGADPERLARAILEAMVTPLSIAGSRLHVLPSIGICCCPEQGESLGDLMSHADVAMMAAKRGQSGYRMFDAAMRQDIHARLVLENDLVLALRRREIEAYYQPRVSLASGRIIGFEALARWRHPERGLLVPAAFIQVAEQTGQIVELGSQIMLMAMQQQRAWAQAGYDLTVSINVSALQLAVPEFPAVVAGNVARARCDPTRIELEITESAMIGDAEAVAATLEQIKALGLRIAIDDFGTGYSNLTYLRRYPLATLKIDRAFIADPEHATLLEAIIRMGQALDLVLVAEGVEKGEQAAWLAERDVSEAQGYFYSRPMPVADSTAYLADEWRRYNLDSAA